MNALQCFAAGLALCVLGPLAGAGAQDVQTRERPAAEGGRLGDRLLPPGAIEKLDLTEAQKEKLVKLHKELQEKLQAADRKHREAIEQARQNQDRRKAQEASEALRKEVAPLQEEFRGQLQQLLTDEQKKRLAELQRGQPFPGPERDLLPRVLEQLDLTGEQKGKVAKLMQESQEKQEVAQKKLREAIEQARQNQDRQKLRELTRAQEKEIGQLREQLLGEVQALLNEEQKKRFAELQRRQAEAGRRPPEPGIGQLMPLPVQERLGLASEQREKIAHLRKETEAKLREIMTEEQNRTFEELKRGGTPPVRRRPRD